MDQDQSLEMDILSLIDEEGNEHEFEIADTMEVDGQEYMALIPLYDDPEEAMEDSAQLVILRVADGTADSDEPELESIQDEEEYDKISQLFMERLEDLYDFEDDEEEETED